VYDRKDIILAVDYHAEHRIRWFNCHTGRAVPEYPPRGEAFCVW